MELHNYKIAQLAQTGLGTHLCLCVHLVVSDSLQPWTIARQAPLSVEFFRQEYWNELLFPSPGIFLPQGSNLCLLHLLHWQVDSLSLSHLGSPL